MMFPMQEGATLDNNQPAILDIQAMRRILGCGSLRGWLAVFANRSFPMVRLGIAFCIAFCVVVPILSCEGQSSAESKPSNRLTMLPANDCNWVSDFWMERQSSVRVRGVPEMWAILSNDENTQFLSNFLIASGDKEGRHRGPSWNDGDFYKWIEAASLAYEQTHDAKLLGPLDQAVAAITKAQKADGYLHTPILIRQRHGDGEARPFSEPLQFELYNFGHLFSAACVHHRATGDRKLLEVAIRAAQYLEKTFYGKEPPTSRSAICPSHYMGLYELSQYTQEPRYARLAKYLIEQRDKVEGGTDDNQDRLPLRSHRTITGHAVRANYLYAGVAESLRYDPDPDLERMLDRVWQDLYQSKIYITGACGALFDGASPDGSSQQKIITKTHQAYGRPYQLPHSTAHNESCATIGNVLWNWRMLLLQGNVKYADALEQSLYNGVLATLSLQGTEYFYTNTLRQLDTMPTDLRWSRQREAFISCYCCPPNILRTILSTQQWAYTSSGEGIQVHLFGSNDLKTRWNGSEIELSQRTDYPWSGKVQWEWKRTPSSVCALQIRIPQWSRNTKLLLNGVDANVAVEAGSYASIARVWKEGDRVELQLDLSVRAMESHPLVEENRNQVAILRGPLVYCLESKDLRPQERVMQTQLVSNQATLKDLSIHNHSVVGLLVPAVHRADERWSEVLYREKQNRYKQPGSALLIPYFAWGNRGPSEMSVWISSQDQP
ncbi:MAG: glycoside hydrolase family 127 protein [Pirellulales bacterium]